MIKKIASIKLTVFILSVLLLFFFVGIYIPQISSIPENFKHNPQQFYNQRFGVFPGSLIISLNLNDAYHSAIFLILLFILILNIIACTFQKKFNLLNSGFYLTHLSVIIIISGFIISNICSDNGMVWIKEGCTINKFQSEKTGLEVNLPFSIYLEKFFLEYSEKSSFGNIFVLLKNTEEPVILDAVVKDEWKKVANSNYKIKINAFHNSIKFDKQNKLFNFSDKYINPALVIQIKKNDVSETRYLFSKFPDFHHNVVFNDIQVLFKFHRAIEQFTSVLKLNNDKTHIVVKVNSPGSYKNYKIYQSSYNPDDLSVTGLEIVKDPGLYLVYTGFYMIIAGIIFIFWIKPVILKKIWKNNENRFN
ncbi:cytochrome c biogenesis protein ResB [Candidatus Dependentiae bacterium]|nr:cytochrome c biogenesis protein ResB [Candidatus Dependentiae bacterium]